MAFAKPWPESPMPWGKGDRGGGEKGERKGRERKEGGKWGERREAKMKKGGGRKR